MKRGNLRDGAVIEWLLDDDNPCVRYLTLTRLLGKSPGDRLAKESRSKIPDWPPVEKILRRQLKNGGWESNREWYHPKYKSTIWQLILLSKTGIDPSLHKVGRMCEYSFRYQSEDGAFVGSTRGNPARDWGFRTGCLNGNVIASFCRLGRAKDARVRRAMDRLLEMQEPDGGWHCRSFGYHARDKHSCFMGAVCGLDAVLAYSATRTSKELEQAKADGAEFLLRHRLFRSDHHGWSVINKEWTMLRGLPFVGYDILRGLRALGDAGFLDDPRAGEALELLESKRLANGRWPREVPWPTNTYSSFGQKGVEDKWVTLDALLVLRSRGR